MCLDVHELRTLLDEGSRPRYDDVVRQATKQWVLFPREDSQSVQLSNQHVAGEACRVLRISDHIEPRSFDLTCQQAPVGRNLDEVCHLLRDLRFPLQSTLPRVSFKDVTLRAIQDAKQVACSMDPSAPISFEIHSDGSFDGESSAWAIVVLCKSGQAFDVRWAADKVCVDPSHNKWLGANEHGSMQAERTGISFALMWALSVCHQMQNQLGLILFVPSTRPVGTGDFKQQTRWRTPVGALLMPRRPSRLLRGLTLDMSRGIAAIPGMKWRTSLPSLRGCSSPLSNNQAIGLHTLKTVSLTMGALRLTQASGRAACLVSKAKLLPAGHMLAVGLPSKLPP